MFWYFVQKIVAKLLRHFDQVHSTEKQVIIFKSINKNNPERLELLGTLRKNGLYLDNVEVIKKKSATIIPKRRKVEEVTPSKLVACVRCNQFYTHTILYRHKKTV